MCKAVSAVLQEGEGCANVALILIAKKHRRKCCWARMTLHTPSVTSIMTIFTVECPACKVGFHLHCVIRGCSSLGFGAEVYIGFMSKYTVRGEEIARLREAKDMRAKAGTSPGETAPESSSTPESKRKHTDTCDSENSILGKTQTAIMTKYGQQQSAATMPRQEPQRTKSSEKAIPIAQIENKTQLNPAHAETKLRACWLCFHMLASAFWQRKFPERTPLNSSSKSRRFGVWGFGVFDLQDLGLKVAYSLQVWHLPLYFQCQ